MDLKDLAQRAIKKVYPRYGLRASDVILASYPKSGNTWVRFIWTNIVSLLEMNGEMVTFHTVTNEIGSEYDSHSYGNVEFDCLPRLVKTHYEYSETAFGANRCVYIVRHPGDVLLSYYEYMTARENSGISREHSLSQFIRSEKFVMPAWTNHVNSWLSKADVIIRYEDMRSGAASIITSILSELDLGDIVDEEVVVEACRRSEFDRMREIEEKEGRPSQGEFKDDFRFTSKGRMGEWREAYDSKDIKYITRSVISGTGKKYEKVI